MRLENGYQDGYEDRYKDESFILYIRMTGPRTTIVLLRSGQGLCKSEAVCASPQRVVQVLRVLYKSEEFVQI